MGDPLNLHTLETVTGKFVDLLNPDPADININDIAWSLSRLARYNGHTIQKLPYSVGQHSIVVANIIRKRFHFDTGVHTFGTKDSEVIVRDLVLQALLHDSGEAYTGDISGPLKKIPELRPIIKKIEANIDLAIYEGLGIPAPDEEAERYIKEADLTAQKIEAYNFMASRGANWGGMPDVSIVDLQEFEEPKPSLDVYHEFLELFNELKYE